MDGKTLKKRNTTSGLTFNVILILQNVHKTRNSVSRLIKIDLYGRLKGFVMFTKV